MSHRALFGLPTPPHPFMPAWSCVVQPQPSHLGGRLQPPARPQHSGGGQWCWWGASTRHWLQPCCVHQHPRHHDASLQRAGRQSKGEKVEMRSFLTVAKKNFQLTQSNWLSTQIFFFGGERRNKSIASVQRFPRLPGPDHFQ